MTFGYYFILSRILISVLLWHRAYTNVIQLQTAVCKPFLRPCREKSLDNLLLFRWFIPFISVMIFSHCFPMSMMMTFVNGSFIFCRNQMMVVNCISTFFLPCQCESRDLCLFVNNESLWSGVPQLSGRLLSGRIIRDHK